MTDRQGCAKKTIQTLCSIVALETSYAAVHTMGLRAIEFRRFLTDRVDAKTYLGLHLTLSLMIAAGALWMFGATFDAVLDNATMVRLDHAAVDIIHRHTTAVGTRVFHAITVSGSPTAMTIVSIVCGAVLLARRKQTLTVTWLAAFGGGAVLEHLIKRGVGRSRPVFAAIHHANESASFPSGHAMLSTLAVGMLVYALIVTGTVRGWTRVAVVVVAFVYVVLVGVSRIYLGVHYPTDVLGGFTAGGGWLAVCVSVAGISLHRRGYALSS